MATEPLGVVADRVVLDAAAAGPAGPAAIVASLLLTLEDMLNRKGYREACVTADYQSAGRIWRLHVIADVVPSLFRRYTVHNLDKAIAAAEEWITSLPEGR